MPSSEPNPQTSAQTDAAVEYQAAYHRTLDERDAHAAEVARLRAGIEAFLAGDYPNPRQHRPGNCQHGRPYYEDCAACDAAHFTRLLAG